jgi:hypothetical protein
VGGFGFWFVPEVLDGPMSRGAMNRMRGVVASKDSTVEVPKELPDFKTRKWVPLSDQSDSQHSNGPDVR